MKIVLPLSRLERLESADNLAHRADGFPSDFRNSTIRGRREEKGEELTNSHTRHTRPTINR